MDSSQPTPETVTDLSNQFLMAMPGMVTGDLAGTVIYLCEHSPKGALGLVINRPTDLSLAGLLEKLELKLEIAPGQTADQHPAHQPAVFFGGPVQTDRGFVLHSPAGDYSSSIKLGRMALTTSRDVLEAVAHGNGPEHLLVTLGFAGWGAGQLENELAQNAWLSVPAQENIIFDIPPQERYPAALKLLGIDPVMLTGAAGHA
ncbi:YqgE/AlgH family protein [Zwartia panacis]|uniref:YqgE/AlgH family protein n=1 Tax=Zwartia panacis TaxID=2683345 RepID=UPI0025B5CDA7|nr:YqgE/AlgH family protein [Zwartia panacis]MDN4016242.1 YqgE/AlgH family protein [Zwartia panacis]